MSKDIIDIVTKKEFIELTSAEREELNEFCTTEDEFNQLKNVFVGVEQLGGDQDLPRKETKQRLDDLFYEVHPKASPYWYSSVLAVVVPKDKPIYRQPLMQIAAVVVLFILAVPFFNNDIATAPNQVAQHEVLIDESPAVEQEDLGLDEVTNEIEDVHTPLVATVSDQESISESVDKNEIDEITNAATWAMAAASSAQVSTHPDGVFIGTDESLALSLPASESEELLDLLTATF